MLEYVFLDIFTDHIQMVNKPKHVSSSLIDHIYITITLMEEVSTYSIFENIYFSDHDAVKIVIEKKCRSFPYFSIKSNVVRE